MNKKILLLLLFLTTLACSSKTEKPIPEQQLEGWAGNPDNPNEKPFDYFYMKTTGRASQKSIAKKSARALQTSCIEVNTYQTKNNIFNKLIGELLLGGSGNFTEVTVSSIAKEYRLKKEIKVKHCYPIAKSGIEESESDWKECECIFYVHIPGGRDAIVAKATAFEGN